LTPQRTFASSNSAKIVKELLDSLRRGLGLGGLVRKFLRIALALSVVPFASLWLWTWYKTAQVESFYQENRLLGEMGAGQDNSTNDSASAREALLRIVPLGTGREAAIALLRREGLGCQAITEPITDTQLRRRFLEARGLTNIPNNVQGRKEFVDCQTMSPNVLGYKQWIVDLQFDAEEHLSDAGVAIWNIFL
jgi:hypothetical protein